LENVKGSALERPRRGQEDNIKVYFKKMEFEGVGWIHPAQGKVQWQASVEHDNEASGSVKGGEFFVRMTINFRSRILLYGILGLGSGLGLTIHIALTLRDY
jgi:hypothetical protein